MGGFDLAVIGSGAAGFAAAIAARRMGARVVMVERATTGGTCVNVGCVPSKALLAAAEARHVAAEAGRFPGVAAAELPVGFGALIAGKDELVEWLRARRYTELAEQYGWEMVAGDASFTGDADAPALRVAPAGGGPVLIEAAHYLVATGSAPWAPPVPGLAEAGYLTSTTAMELQAVPESMIVIGGNAVGVEMAQLFSRLGTQVAVVEALDRLVPFEEPEVSAALEQVFVDEAIAVHTGATLAFARPQDGEDTGDGFVRAVVRDRDGAEVELSAERLLVATGRRPATAGLGLDLVGVETGAHGQVVVDEHARSGNARIWAAGDVVGGPQFVYVAAAQGTLVADNALADAHRTLDYTALPKVTFTSPTIASVGMTDAQVGAAGLPCDCRVLPLTAVPRALVNRDTRGLVKLVAHAASGQVLGVHVIAEGAGEIISTAACALSAGHTVQRLAHAWAPYLTMAEALKLAAQTFTTDVAALSCCAG